ncbi:RNA-directed DNA polymerase, eukaryota, reverse transcriptase zinc-binding domain protein [Tanacetum coccineum]
MGDDDWQEVTYKKRRSGFDRLDLPSIQTKPTMGSYRSKEDDLAKIFVSVFITNLPDSCSAKDLFNYCKQYGHVVDSFIPNKRSIAGKRFGFVRFINVFNEERLVNNLSTLWIGRQKLQANLARFKRNSSNEVKKVSKEKDGRMDSKNHSIKQVNVTKNSIRFSTSKNSFAQAVTGKNYSGGVENDSCPALVLDDECLLSNDISNSLFCRVKEFASLANLKSIKLFRENESIGSWFSCISQANMDFITEGRVAWVEIEGIPFKLWSNNTFKRIANRWGALIDFEDQEEPCYHSKRLCIHTKSGISIMENFKIIHRGKVYWVRATETPGWVPDFADEDNEDDQGDISSKDDGLDDHGAEDGEGESDMDEVPETLFENVGLEKSAFGEGGTNECEGGSLKYPPGFTPKESSKVEPLKEEENQNIGEDNLAWSSKNQSEDPFGLYKILNKKKGNGEQVGEPKDSIPYPTGFPPNEDGFSNIVISVEEVDIHGQNVEQEEGEIVSLKGQTRKETTMDTHDSICSGHFKKSNGSRTGGSIIQCIEDLVNVGQTMGYDMSGCLKNMENIIESQGVSVWGNFSFDYVHSDAVGQSGGILSVWDPSMFQKSNCSVSDYFVMVYGMWIPSGKNLLVISIYAPQELSEKRMLWDYLRIKICNWDGDVVIMGDFNEVRASSERFGSVFNKRGAKIFNEFIANAGLVEVPLGGCSFTWCHKSASKMSKLDRFLISDNLLGACPGISSVSLDRYLSDHRPILLREAYYDYGPIPFKLYHYWFEFDGFDKFVEDSWKEIRVSGTNDYVCFTKKLRILKDKIKKWIRLYKDRTSGQMNILKSELSKLDSDLDKGVGDKIDVQRRQEIICKIQDLEKNEAIESAQKAKIKWAIEGDENSKYYHGVINKKRSNLAIRGVQVDGKWVEPPSLVKKAFYDHFKRQFEHSGMTDISLDREFSKRVSSDQVEDMERGVSKEEIKRAVWDCEGDVIKAITWFFHHGSIPNGGNPSFITLIPKIPNANMVKDFRPISLIGSIYKIIAKILANRLVTVLGDLVSDTQSAFVKDRQILDGPFILNELAQWCKKKRKQSMVFKVDFEKAYDFVRWEFIDTILKKIGFGDKWCKWIGGCLRSSRGSVLVNGSPTVEFQFFKGLKQGDPLSPFLFILVMESLHVSFQRVVDGGLFSGIKLDNSITISHLFYADDAIFMGQWNRNNLAVMTRVLDIFHQASGLRINMIKSKILGISVEPDTVEKAAKKIGCTVLKLPFNYLGSKVGDLMSRSMSWNEVLEKMVTRLSRWKQKTISIGGRLTLLKSVLGSIPIFHMSMFKVPKTVLKAMEAIWARFFNRSDISSRKPCWVSWKKAMASKESGGLGVASLFALNRALMLKWVWHFITQKESLWARVIKAIHGEEGKIGKKVYSSFPSIWLSIIQEMGVLKSKGIDFLSYIKLKCGDGSRTSFWEDLWRGDVAFKDLVPRLYMLENMKDVTVAVKLAHEDLEWSFRRKSRSGIEQHQLELLQEKIDDVILSSSYDRWAWSLEGSGEFSVSSLRKVIDLNYLPRSSLKTRWIKEVLIKINIHAWKVSNDYLPTRLNLSRRGLDIESIVCPLYNILAESSSHLFFLCDVSQQIMRKIMRWWELDFQEINSYNEWVNWMLNIRLSSNSKKVFEGIWNGVPLTVAACLSLGDATQSDATHVVNRSTSKCHVTTPVGILLVFGS